MALFAGAVAARTPSRTSVTSFWIALFVSEISPGDVEAAAELGAAVDQNQRPAPRRQAAAATGADQAGILRFGRPGDLLSGFALAASGGRADRVDVTADAAAPLAAQRSYNARMSSARPGLPK
jgi:hypothetical protein